MSTPPTIALLGVGAMGSRMAVNLLQAGYPVILWNRTAEKLTPLLDHGAQARSTPREAVQGAAFVICMARDDQASHHIWLDPEIGALAGLSPHTIAIDSSTLTVAWVRSLAERFHQAQIPFLEAPVAGSRPQAEAAQLIYFVGGEPEVLAQAQPIFKTLGRAIHHAGAVGSGAAIKLAVNTLFSVQLATLAELIGMLQGSGVDPQRALEILSATPVCSPAAQVGVEAMLTGQFAPLFPIELVEKDLGYAIQTAQAGDRQMPLTKATRQVFAQAIAQGYGGDNITGVAQLYG